MKATLDDIARALNVTKRSAERRANDGEWDFTTIPVRGGQQRLYDVDKLPLAVAKPVYNLLRPTELEHGNDNHSDGTGLGAGPAALERTAPEGRAPAKHHQSLPPAHLVHGRALGAAGLPSNQAGHQRSGPSPEGLCENHPQRRGAHPALGPTAADKIQGQKPRPPVSPEARPAHRIGQDRHDLTAKQRDKDRARDYLLRFIEQHPAGQAAAIRDINAQAAEGKLSPPLASAIERARAKSSGVKKHAGVLSLHTVNKWKRLRSARGNLAPLATPRDMRVMPWHAAAVAIRQKPQGVTLTYIESELQAQFGAEAPSYHQIARFFRDKFSVIDQLKGRLTGSALKAHQFTHRRNRAGLWPMQEVHADGWNTHFTAPHPQTGEFVTYEVWHFHDVATRYVFPPSIALSENFEVIANGLENCIRVGGVMGVLQTDSTGSVKNDRFEYDPVTSISARAGITIKHPLIGNSQANGICENFNRYLDARSKELATYQHQSMDKLTFKRVKKLTAQMVRAESTEDRARFRDKVARMGKGLVFDSQAQAVDWINRVHEEFNDRPHRALDKIFDGQTGKKRHRTPREEWNLARAEQASLGAGEWCAVMLSAEDLADLFRVREARVVVRGRVTLYGQDYSHPDLEHWNGKSVFVAYDRHDGSRVWVEDHEGRLITEAAFYNSRDYRSRSVYEIVLNKRADAQIKRLEKKTEQIQSRRPTALIDQTTGAPLVPLDITPEPEPVNVVALPTAERARPMFDSDAEMYQWLKRHPGDITAHDRAWIADYRTTGEYQDLFADREAREPGDGDKEVAAG